MEAINQRKRLTTALAVLDSKRGLCYSELQSIQGMHTVVDNPETTDTVLSQQADFAEAILRNEFDYGTNPTWPDEAVPTPTPS